MEKELNLSWNTVPIIEEVVVDEIFNLPDGYGNQYAPVFDTKGKNFDKYDFVIFEAVCSGFTPDITKFDSIGAMVNQITYDQKDTTIRDEFRYESGNVSGLTATMSLWTFIDNPPNGWDAEKEGKAKAELIRVNTQWYGEYTYTIEGSSPQPATHGFNANILWNNGKITVHTFNEDKDDEVTVRLKITGYIGATHS